LLNSDGTYNSTLDSDGIDEGKFQAGSLDLDGRAGGLLDFDDPTNGDTEGLMGMAQRMA
jgi:hypothetical protein